MLWNPLTKAAYFLINGWIMAQAGWKTHGASTNSTCPVAVKSAGRMFQFKTPVRLNDYTNTLGARSLKLN
eukprot:1140757-Pelagomonas_calceolata.AAC.2